MSIFGFAYLTESTGYAVVTLPDVEPFWNSAFLYVTNTLIPSVLGPFPGSEA